jgi:hypothetical protein
MQMGQRLMSTCVKVPCEWRNVDDICLSFKMTKKSSGRFFENSRRVRIPNQLVAPAYIFQSLESRIYVKLHFIGHISAATHSVAAEIY